MCAIVGSFSPVRFVELMKLNMYRGSFSFSVTVMDNTLISNTSKSLGQFNSDIFFKDLPISKSYYYLGHIQAPTGGLVKDINRVHPAQVDSFKFLHNGIIKSKEVKRLQSETSSGNKWDTYLMLYYLYQKRIENIGKTLSEIDGSFACALLKENDFFYIFRNPPGILFVDKELTISSTKFKGSEILEENKIFSLDLINKRMNEIQTFTSKSDPYYLGE